MKNYRKLIPVIMIFLMSASIYYYVDNIKAESREYNTYITNGDNYFKEELYVKALAEYAKAQDMRLSVDIDKKIADCYEVQNLNRETENQYEKILADYPKEIKAYEYTIEYYMRSEDYATVYSIYSIMAKRGLSSEKTAEIISEIQYKFYLSGQSYIHVKDFLNGYAVIENADGYKGLANVYGNETIGCKYKNIGIYLTECIPVATEKDVYFIDINENKTMNYKGESEVSELGPYSDSVYWAKSGDSYAYYNAEGEKLSEDYEDVTNFNGGIAQVKKNGVWAIINKNFEQISSATYANLIVDENGNGMRGGVLFVNEEGNGYQMINSNGELISEEYYEDARLMSDNTYVAVKKEGKWGFVDAAGNVHIEFQYEDARSFSNGFAAVKQEGKWGFINTNGEIVIEPQFEDAKNFSAYKTCYIKNESGWRLLTMYSGSNK